MSRFMTYSYLKEIMQGRAATVMPSIFIPSLTKIVKRFNDVIEPQVL
jgi:hypothetical protein